MSWKGIFLLPRSDLLRPRQRHHREEEALHLFVVCAACTFEDDLDVLRESHVQHLICFVQVDDVALMQIEVATFKVVYDASRSSNNDVSSLAKIACLEPGGM
jgi:hypothetical protein